MRITLTLITGLILSSTMVWAESTDMSKMDHSTMAMDEAAIEGAVHAKAVVNSFGDGTVNVSHEPIPEIGWPAMTMDMPLLDSFEMTGEIAEGDTVIMMLIKGDDGMYAISALSSEM
ncbi:MAG: copper-binding protein [Loktanella sp.]|nr:copper-binding protein [Loktanella sp.]MDO7723582.1 copper-binding protein [Loktanella sp.]